MLGSNLLEKDVHVGQYVQLVTKTTENMFQHSYSFELHEDRIKLNDLGKSLCYFVSTFFDMHYYSCTYRSVVVHTEVDLVLFYLPASAQLSSTFLLFTSF